MNGNFVNESAQIENTPNHINGSNFDQDKIDILKTKQRQIK